MSDNPYSPESIPEEPAYTGGWRKPTVPGTWHPPQRRVSDENEGSQVVPAMPANLEVTPEAEGAWHLPKPEDTTLSVDSQIQINTEPDTGIKRVEILRPEDLLFAQERSATPAAVRAEREVRPEDEIFNRAAPARQQTEIPTEDDLQEEPPDDEDSGLMSMSELVALASLVEERPKADIVPLASASTAVETPAREGAQSREAASPELAALQQSSAGTPTAAENDAADYARRQLELLGGGAASSTSGMSPIATDAAGAEQDAAEYARRQLQQLGASQAQPAVEPAAAFQSASVSSLTQEQITQARKFQETEEQVKALRQRYQSNQMSRDDLQAELRQLMILDENRTWWMMGIESDSWFRFDNGQWVNATPPALVAFQGAQQQAQRGSFTTDSGSFIPVSSGSQLDYLNSQQVEYSGQLDDNIATQPYATGQTGAIGSIVPGESFVVRPGPERDPDLTQVGQGAAIFGQSNADVYPPAERYAPTIMNEAVQSPLPREDEIDDVVPLYDIDQVPSQVYDEIAQRQRQRQFSSALIFAAILVGIFALVTAGGVLLLLSQYSSIASQYQSQVEGLANYRPVFQTAKIVDANNELIVEINSQQGGARTVVPLEDISPYMIHAVVSVENERFFDDPGWDPIAIGRAFLQNVGSGEVESGASTITQQIARQLILQDSTVSAARKLDEIVIAAEIGKLYDKNFILALYLNEIYFGNQSYGVEAAAQFYFDKGAADLNLPEAAFLAGIIQRPAIYDPVQRGGESLQEYGARRDGTFTRMEFVIQRMADVGCLQFQHAPYLAEPFCVNPTVLTQNRVPIAQVKARNYDAREVTFRYPHFVQFVQAVVENTYGSGEMFRRGFTIRTTLNPSVQDIADTTLRQIVAQYTNAGVNTGAVMVIDPRNGAIRAMVGSPNFNDSSIDGQVNNAFTWQQPGSAIKPVVYAGAFEGVDSNGDGIIDRYLTPASIIWDVQTTFPNTNPPYTPTNFDNVFHGPVAVRYALQNSYNVPAVKTYEFIGNDKFINIAGRMGLTFLDEAQFNLTTGIGSTDVRLYDMMATYATIANNGTRSPLYAIESITDSAGTPVELPARAPQSQAISPQLAYLLQNILSDDAARAAAFGANSALTIPGVPPANYVAAKSGTSNQARDMWTMGFTKNVVVGVWLGRHDNNPTFAQAASFAAAPAWQRIMSQALQLMPGLQPFTNPGGVVERQICPDTGTLPPTNCTALRNELFIQNQPPPEANQAFVQTIDVDTWTGLRANQYCPDNRLTGTFANISDPAAIQWLQSAAGRAFAARVGLPDPLVTAPANECSVNTEVPIARIIQPIEGQTVIGEIQITGAASASNFNRYQLQIAPGANNRTDSAFSTVSGPATIPQTSGTLGTWNTVNIPNGTYTLRLNMIAGDGGFLNRYVNIAINNPLPTATPLPVATQPPLQFPTSEPLPFIDSGLGATPTATISIGG